MFAVCASVENDDDTAFNTYDAVIALSACDADTALEALTAFSTYDAVWAVCASVANDELTACKT